MCSSKVVPSLVAFSHTMDETLLEGKLRGAMGGVPITGLRPGLAEDVWKRFVAYTSLNPGTASALVAFEFLNCKRIQLVCTWNCEEF